MPCYEVRLVSVEFKASNEKILQEAAKALSWGFSKFSMNGTTVQVGRVIIHLDQQTAEGRQDEINALKRAYSTAAVKAAAKAKGWTLESWKEKAGVKSTVAIKY